MLLLATFAGGWTALYGVVELREDELALITRAGRVVRQIEGAGRHLHLPFPLERRAIVSLASRSLPPGRIQVVTRNAQTLGFRYTGSYRVDNPRAARFAVRSPDALVAAAVEGALIELARDDDDGRLRGRGSAPRPGLVDVAQRKADAQLLALGAGLAVEALSLEVSTSDAFSQLDAEIETLSSKREDAESAARATREALLVEARARALEVSTQAALERDALVAKAAGEAERFKALAAEYRRAPEVMRTRIYLETMEEILGRARLVIAEPGAPLPEAAAERRSPTLPDVSAAPAAHAGQTRPEPAP